MNYLRSSSVGAEQIVVQTQTPNDYLNGQRNVLRHFQDGLFRLTIDHLQSVVDIVSLLHPSSVADISPEPSMPFLQATGR